MADECFVVCVAKASYHTADSLLGVCSQCGCEVWVSPHNKNEQLICLDCVKKMPKEDVRFGIKQADLFKAAVEIAKMRRKEKHVS